MELTAGVLITLTLVVAGLAVLLRRSSGRREDRASTPALVVPAPTNFRAAPGERDSQALLDWLLSRAFEQTGVNVADDAMARQRVTQAARKALDELRFQPSVVISLPFLTADASGPKHFETRVTRDTVDDLAT